ncbi:Esterase PHB depolymerase [Modestobacter sp. DSM 44400]|uniref:extracellular catalytic domain type 2 short-chain-length polyhydroxyalkanoate depolymerase n=1 Tax=Modestobacter sp. DSM 44400 TaxID=1550230 RepID=UPI00089B0554|nr:PHB depolymerase family esterase [Modestobacter sp. DSM 44400]SDY30844.1 Esterase PHB depolymerase [Modestobacter sp. DSM 44400]
MDQTTARSGVRRGALRRRLAVLGAAVVAVAALTVGETAQAAPAGGALPRLAVTGNFVTGISSGGYMATQLQVAYSSRFRGAGVFSAGPYWCAQDNVAIALYGCTVDTVPTDVATSYAKTDEYARAGKIDPTKNLTRSRTYFFHGTQDPTVVQSLADDLAAYYRHYAAPLTYRSTLAAGHAWISPLGPVACGNTAAPYINNCPGYDAEADLLKTMFGSVKKPNNAAPRGRVTSFSQDPYAVPAQPGNGDLTKTGAAAIGMGATGYLYTPDSCASGATCAVVVALHGCLQTADQIGTTFVERSGLNAYADTNDFVVLYPQATPTTDTIVNPKGCWDWWGYLGPNDVDYANKLGPQMRAVMNMVSALGG